MDLEVKVSVCASRTDRFSHWSLSVENGAGLRIVDVQCPFVVVPAEGAVVLPAGHGGHLLTDKALQQLPPDVPQRWRFVPENGNSPHYPGRVFAQFLAWYHQNVGLYLACQDVDGNVKLLQPLSRCPGIRLGIAHVGDWPEQGARVLEYEVVLGSFAGDWYDAAGIYRDWSLSQKWGTPLTRRTDVPQWLLDSPPHITIRLQGYVDAGPTPAIQEFLPYEKCLPLLDAVSHRVDAPLVAVLMSWERGGPWVYPDCFPPVGGEDSLCRFIAQARQRGWQVGSFCNGTRWVMGHRFNGYDGSEYFQRHGGQQSVCRCHDGAMWAEGWDAGWRPSYICCMAQELTCEIATGFVQRLIDWGMESIQFFDQNCNAATFPCFASDHGHPPVPGKWMAAAMEALISEFGAAAKRASANGVIQSTECPCNEYCLPLFQQSDIRPSPPSCGEIDFIPLYHYLFHECTIMHGMMSIGPEPYSLEIRNAWNGVLGQVPGAVMTGDGSLLNRETFNWAEWHPKIGNNDDALAMIRSVTALRRGPGRDLLVFGQMQRPAQLEEVELISWEWEGKRYDVPAVFHSAWTTPDGRHGVVLANWTNKPQIVSIVDARLGPRTDTWTIGLGPASDESVSNTMRHQVEVPALGCALVTTPV
jgi:hypothetical protein